MINIFLPSTLSGHFELRTTPRKHSDVALCLIQYGEINPKLCMTVLGNSKQIKQHTAVTDSDPMVDWVRTTQKTEK